MNPTPEVEVERLRAVIAELETADRDPRLFVNDERTVLVVMSGGAVSVATRDHPSDTWGPPTYLTDERRAT